MRRGDIWTLKAEGYASKARPVVVVESDAVMAEFDSVIVCLLTSYESEGVATRVKVVPSDINGLNKTSYIMTDKIVTVDKNQLGSYVGSLEAEIVERVSRQLVVVLDIRSST